jgi:nitroimidazol reductase NimA-like FMN-containing flavoprotein (pyridoxamine 5'-phosphate oxidase superfamily)
MTDSSERDVDERPPIREMRSSECWERIAAAPYGRLVTSAAGEIDIFPVNHGVDRYSIVFRTSPGTKLLELTVNRQVVFQVDGIDGDEAFSVVVKGDADQFDRPVDVAKAQELGISTWAPGRRERWVRITARDIQGRAFMLPPSAERA